MEIVHLKDYGIPESVIQKIIDLGFSELTEVQQLAVERGLFEGKNLVISAPTNTGKTFIAELAALVASKRRERKRTFYLIPLKAIAEEKFEEFKKRYADWGLEVAISTGERSEFDTNIMEYDLILATYEKLNALLIRSPELIRDVGVVVVDELQMVGDKERGVDLEMLLTRLCKTGNPPQIIGLSATIPNAEELAEWLEANVAETKRREVELREGILYNGKEPLSFKGNEIREGDFFYKEFNTGKLGIEKALNIHLFEGLVKISQREQVIIFKNTRREAEELALQICGHLPPSRNITKWIEEIDTLIESTPSTRNLKKCMINGVAFHHAGLLPEEKRIVEEAFEEGDIRVICATTTLGAGVNTPAKNVMILSTTFWDGRSIMSRDYKNMSGRAGRIKYHDNFGRSLLFAKTDKDFERFWREFINAEAEKVETQVPKKDNIQFSILSLVVSGISKNSKELIRFMENTFFGYTYYQKSDNVFKGAFEESISKQIDDLVKSNLLEERDGGIRATTLGKRCAEEMISPRSADIIFQSLKKDEDRISQSKDYKDLIEPLFHLACCTPDARLLYPPKNQQEIRELWTYWNANKSNYLYDPDEDEEELVLQSVKTLQMLLRWIDGVPYSDMAGFAPQGVIKSTGENISWLIKSVRRIIEPPLFDFAEEITAFLVNLSERARYGVKENATEIMKLNIPAIHRRRAMLLADAGYGSLESIIEANIEDLKKIKGIGDKLAVKIKEHIERFIKVEIERKHQYFIRRATELGREPSVIEKLFRETGDNFSRVCAELFEKYIGLPCKFIGDISPHEPDCLVEINDERIVIECKRKIGNRLVSANEAEEVLGKGVRYSPVASVTIGYPDFANDAKQNVSNTEITLITHTALARILISFWEKKLSKEEIVDILKSRKYISDQQYVAPSFS
jgi:helicase